MSFARAGAVADLWVGEMRSVVVGGTAVLLVRLGDGVRAYEDRCAHKGVALSAGTLAGTLLTCATHGWQYDVATGRGVNPASAALRAFAVRLEGDDVLVDVDDGRGRLTALARPSDDVGPVLQEGPEAAAIVRAIRRQNADVRVIDRGSYLRVLCPRRCVVTRVGIEAELGRPFRLPRDLELVISSFKGRFHVSESEASWELGEAQES
ncbi:MAG: Toluene-4-monooxygenase, subunit TmoC [Myxococcales bacterium]|nr:Toluene-4-monooxygenase, subunit TmoC [Myxococcales bacterium]